jgi:hypothetical protein
VAQILVEQDLPASIRIFPRAYLESPLGTAASDSRFCAKADEFSLLYTAPEFATAFVEVIVRDRFTRKSQREIFLKEVTGRAWALIASKRAAKLKLVDLRGDTAA